MADKSTPIYIGIFEDVPYGFCDIRNARRW
jgi:hypothetical protein